MPFRKLGEPLFSAGLARRSEMGSGMLNTGLSIALPQNMIDNAGELLHGFEALTGWSTGTGTKETNTSEKYEGAASMKITSGVGANTTHTLQSGISWDLTSKHDNFLISIYNHGAQATVDNVVFYLASVADFTKYFGCFKQSFRPGWNHILIRGSDLTANGGEVWTSPMIRFRINCIPTSGNQSILSFDRFWTNTQMRPFVLLTFDDGTPTNYTKAFPYIKSKGMVGTLYSITSQIGQVGYMTAAQFVEMNNAGWDIGNHTNSHTNLTTLTQQQQQDEVTTAQGILDGLGLTRASKHVAYPFGQNNATTEAAMIAAEMLTGRTVSGTGANDYIWPITTNYNLPARSFDNTISLATAKGYIDTIVSTKRGMNFLFHVLDDDAAGASQWKTSDFQELIDYIRAQGVQTLTVDEYYRLQSGAITVNHR